LTMASPSNKALRSVGDKGAGKAVKGDLHPLVG